jgi:hypothetical protein
MKIENSIRLRISPDVDPDEVTASLSVTPTRIVRKGDKINSRFSRVPRYAKSTYWQLDSKAPLESSLPVHFEAILAEVQSGGWTLNEISAKYNVLIVCVVFLRGKGKTTFSLNQEIIKQVITLSNGIDIDLYSLSDKSEKLAYPNLEIVEKEEQSLISISFVIEYNRGISEVTEILQGSLLDDPCISAYNDDQNSVFRLQINRNF